MKGGLTGLMIGIVILVVAMIPALAGLQGVGLAIAGVLIGGGFLVAMRYGGMMGFVETLELLSHTASYLRIMAVGLSDAIFATAINTMAGSMPRGVGIIAALFFHALHLVIALFTPTIHAMRLNFYEFGQKYYEKSNAEYKPFQKVGGEKSA